MSTMTDEKNKHSKLELFLAEEQIRKQIDHWQDIKRREECTNGYKDLLDKNFIEEVKSKKREPPSLATKMHNDLSKTARELGFKDIPDPNKFQGPIFKVKKNYDGTFLMPIPSDDNIYRGN